MKVFELINALACFAGDEDVYLDTESFDLLADEKTVCVLPEGAPAIALKYSSESASAAARKAGLELSDFEGQKPSGSKGFTVADVTGIAEAKAALEAAAAETELEETE